MSNTEQPTEIDQFVTSAEVLQIVGLSRSHQTRLEKAGLFPKRIKLGRRRVVWSKNEVYEWMTAAKEERHMN